MSKEITEKKNYKTSLGIIVQACGAVIGIIGLVLVTIGFLNEWIPESFPSGSLIFMGIAMSLLGETLNLYAGQWSTAVKRSLYVTTTFLALAVLFYLGSMFGLNRFSGHVLLIIGIIMEYILTGNMKKEAQYLADPTSAEVPATMMENEGKQTTLSMVMSVVGLVLFICSSTVADLMGLDNATSPWGELINSLGLLLFIVGIATGLSTGATSKMARYGAIVGAVFTGIGWMAMSHSSWVFRHSETASQCPISSGNEMGIGVGLLLLGAVMLTVSLLRISWEKNKRQLKKQQHRQ